MDFTDYTIKWYLHYPPVHKNSPHQVLISDVQLIFRSLEFTRDFSEQRKNKTYGERHRGVSTRFFPSGENSTW
jgi:hypothetical protein